MNIWQPTHHTTRQIHSKLNKFPPYLPSTETISIRRARNKSQAITGNKNIIIQQAIKIEVNIYSDLLIHTVLQSLASIQNQHGPKQTWNINFQLDLRYGTVMLLIIIITSRRCLYRKMPNRLAKCRNANAFNAGHTCVNCNN